MKSSRQSRDKPLKDKFTDSPPLKKEDEPQVMVWTCEFCQRPNEFAEGASCLHNDGKEPCQGNLEMMENFETKEMSISEYKKLLEAWQKQADEKKKKKEEEN